MRGRLIALVCAFLFFAIVSFFLGSRKPAAFGRDAPDTASDAQWERAYDGITIGQIRAEVETLNLYLAEHTQAYYDTQFKAGNYEIVEPVSSNTARVALKAGDDLAAWRLLPGGVLAKVTLPVEGFEEAYVTRSRISFLMEKEQQIQEFLELQKKTHAEH